jgi:hypothetical protein
LLTERLLGLLAYIFWRPRTEVKRADYERALVDFYKALRIVKPRGFVDCFGYRLDSLP